MLTATLLEDKVEYYGHNFPYSITVMNSSCMTGTDYGWHNTTKHNNVTTYSYVKISLGNDLAKQGNLVMPSSVSLSVSTFPQTCHATCVANAVLKMLAHALGVGDRMCGNCFITIRKLVLHRHQYICFSDFSALITLAND